MCKVGQQSTTGKEIGNPSSQQNLVMMSQYECPSSAQTLEEGGWSISVSPVILGVLN